MTVELASAIFFFALTMFALIFSLTKSSNVEAESFPNRGRFYVGLVLWIITGIIAVFMSFPGYSEWFVPTIYPIMKISFTVLFIAGFFMILTTLIAFPIHMNYYRREIDGRSDRIALLENIRQITAQPYPITELFTLVLKELGSFLVVKKGAMFLVNPSRREMYLVAQIGLDKDELGRLERFALGQDIISRAAAEQTPFISGDLATSDTSSRKLILAGRNLTLSAAVAPLSSRDRSMGALMVLSEKPFRFEKQDRMLLNAAAEAIAGVVESNRLVRENQKLTKQLDAGRARLENMQNNLVQIAKTDDSFEVLPNVCRYLVEQYGVTACRVVHPVDGSLQEIARFKTSSEPESSHGESYQIAVIEAIKQKKMVVLNQEARNSEGGTYISRSTLLCPLTLKISEDYALLVEAPGNGLHVNELFISDIENAVCIIALALNISSLQKTDFISQTAVQSLLQILKIKGNTPPPQIFRQFLDQAAIILPPMSSALIFTSDKDEGYCVENSYNIDSEKLTDIIFLPGEGPVGKVFANGETLEYSGLSNVEKGWSDTEPLNRDFFSNLFGEKGAPNYQFNIPVKTLDQVSAVLAVFNHHALPQISKREKGLLLLASHLLTIKLSMVSMDDHIGESISDSALRTSGNILNRTNNDLAAIIGRAQLLERQHDVSGRVRYTAGEILRAAESAAGAIKKLQKGLSSTNVSAASKNNELNLRLERFLESRHVSGNLFMFDDNRPFLLQKDLAQSCPYKPLYNDFFSIIETFLRRFVTLLDEGDEVLIRSELREGYFYISLVRGSQEKHRQFDPLLHDFGDPDVLPDELFGDELRRSVARNKGEVSFDRFGRQPTYISFRFPYSDVSIIGEEHKAEPNTPTLRILAIDDQQMILDLLSGICQSLGLELTAVRTPAEGISLFRQNKFDIVMIDLAIGETSGWEIAPKIKELSPRTPVIMMTGWDIDVSAEEAARSGVDFTLAKPFKIEQLTEIVNRARLKLISS
jgi:CheY-like chemotaxis protein